MTRSLVSPARLRLVAALAVLSLLPVAARAEEEAVSSDKPTETEVAESSADRSSRGVARKIESPAIVGMLYRFHLNTGRTFEGTVRTKGMFEKRERTGEFVACEREVEGAGVRVWFPRLQNGYWFLHAESIERIEELGELTREDAERIQNARREAAVRAEKQRQDALRRLQELRRRETAEDAADGAGDDESVDTGSADTGAASTDDAESTGASKADLDREAAYQKLLVRFPPSEWKPERKKLIEERKVVLGLFPSSEEKAFLAVYSAWTQAYRWWEARVSEQSTGGKEQGDDAGTGKGDESAKTDDDAVPPPTSDETTGRARRPGRTARPERTVRTRK